MNIHKIFIILILIAGCSFSDDGSSVLTLHEPVDVHGNLPTLDPLPSFCGGSGCVASNFETAEYYTDKGGNQNFLDMVNASSAYAYLANQQKSWAGNNVRVAVVDWGVLATHSNLDANYSSASESTSNQDIFGHGTHVAGIVAGEKNGQEMHGIAPYAEIVSIAITGLGDGEGNFVNYGTSNWKDEIISSNSTVINNSWITGNTRVVQNYNDIMDIINDNSKRVVLFAAGNDGTENPDYPAQDANHTDMKGQMLAVISIDNNNDKSDFSAKCGVTKDFCIAAPGNSIYSTYNDGGYKLLSGTSMATPVVSGAAAILQAAWPSLSGATVVQILLDTATDLGTAGVDDTFGHGLLNIYAAVQNQGTSSVYINSNSTGYSYDNTKISLPTTISASLNNSSLQNLLNQGVFFDKYGRDYKADYNSKINTYNNTNKFSNFFSNHNQTVENIGFTDKNNLTLNLSRKIDHNDKIKLSTEEKETYDLNKVSYNFNIGKIGFNIGQKLGISSHEKSLNLNLVTGQNHLSSYDQIAKYDILNFNSNIDLTKNISLQHKFIYGENEYTNTNLKGIINQLSHKFHNIKFDYEFSIYQEEDSFYGMSGNGAFDIAKHGDSKSFGISILSQNKGKFNYYLSSKWSKMTPEYNSVLISGDKEFISGSYALALIYDKDKNNKLGINISKPWSVDKGNLSFTIPTGLDAQGVVQTKSATIDLSDHNETNYEFFWYKNLKQNSKIKFNLVQRIFDSNSENSQFNDTSEFYVQYSNNF